MNPFIYVLGILLYNHFTFQSGGRNILVFAKKSTGYETIEIYTEMVKINCDDLLNGTSRTDFHVRLTDYFREWDKNNDSYVTVEEFVGWENDHTFKLDDNLAEAWLKQYDFDNDGMMSVDEFASNKVDANNDVTLTMEECMQYDLKKLHNALNALKSANTTTDM